MNQSLSQPCRICGNEFKNNLHQVREMFAGTRETFIYLECSACETLQISQLPQLSKCYSPDYYSFRTSSADAKRESVGLRHAIASFARRLAADHYSGIAGPINGLITQQVTKHAEKVLLGFPEYLRNLSFNLNFNRNSRILDVGSGAGHTLVALSHFGFRKLLGVDPFLPDDICQPQNVKLLKADLSELKGTFDLILVNHSIEHMADVRTALTEIYRLLEPGHFAIVRMPIKSEAWQQYGVDWVQLDAPRHLAIFSEGKFCELAREAGFDVANVRYDSTAFQFWGSEQYRQDIPLLDERSYLVNPEKSIFSEAQMARFTEQARRWNEAGKGDQAVFYLRRQ